MTRRVVVVGGGNAALCAAISAAENGAQVTLLERAPYELRRQCRTPRCHARGLRRRRRSTALMPDLTRDEIKRTDFRISPFGLFDDLGRVTQ
jgi:tricarballylate dehydrogenase